MLTFSTVFATVPQAYTFWALHILLGVYSLLLQFLFKLSELLQGNLLLLIKHLGDALHFLDLLSDRLDR